MHAVCVNEENPENERRVRRVQKRENACKERTSVLKELAKNVTAHDERCLSRVDVSESLNSSLRILIRVDEKWKHRNQ